MKNINNKNNKKFLKEINHRLKIINKKINKKHQVLKRNLIRMALGLIVNIVESLGLQEIDLIAQLQQNNN
jgi:hypothetical protein